MIRTLAETGSTNADIAAALRGGERWPEGDWLVARRQVAGKGRQGRAWCGGEGNFAGSTVVHVTPHDPPVATLSFAACLAIYEATVPILENPAGLLLKWPNDVLLDGGKLSGILLERVGDTTIVGIGVNLAFAPQVPGRRTAALADAGTAPDPADFAQRLARSFDIELSRWRQFGSGPLFARWAAAAHPHGTPIMVHDGHGDPVSGSFDGLGPDGALMLRLPDGAVRAIHAGDVILPERS